MAGHEWAWIYWKGLLSNPLLCSLIYHHWLAWLDIWHDIKIDRYLHHRLIYLSLIVHNHCLVMLMADHRFVVGASSTWRVQIWLCSGVVHAYGSLVRQYFGTWDHDAIVKAKWLVCIPNASAFVKLFSRMRWRCLTLRLHRWAIYINGERAALAHLSWMRLLCFLSFLRFAGYGYWNRLACAVRAVLITFKQGLDGRSCQEQGILAHLLRIISLEGISIIRLLLVEVISVLFWFKRSIYALFQESLPVIFTQPYVLFHFWRSIQS